MNLETWLMDLGLDQYAVAFAENGIDLSLLPELTNEDLKDLGIDRLVDRKTILKAIARISESEEAPAAGAPAPMANSGERRQVTVLFADIAGFTAISERLGAEATHAVLNRYFAIADRIIEDFGGSIDKHIGDNVMAVFGAPIAHDNDPERAVRAALAIHEAAREIETPAGPLSLHIGIANGQVVASGTGSDSHREYTVTGDTVNLAARLEGVAKPGQTLVSEGVQQSTAGKFAVTSLGPLELKGIERPDLVWRIEAVAENATYDRGTIFVGRRSELGQCRVILAEVARTGQGRTILLRGAAGIGKTRLAEEVLSCGRDTGFAIHHCLVLDFGSRKGQEAIPVLVCSLLGLPPSSTKDDRSRAADDALTTGAFAEADRIFLNELLDLTQSLELRRLYDAMSDAARRSGRRALVAKLTAWAGRTRPQLILVEDLHWADAQTLDNLAAVMATASEYPVVLLATTRPEGDPLERDWHSVSLDQPISIITIGPLRTSEALEMAMGFARTNQDRLTECLERAAGNPLFLEQLLQNVAESASSMVPGSIQSLVLARMDRLDPPDKRALQAASVFGQRFTLAALRQLLDAPGYDCAGLLQNQLIRPEGEDLLFAHALIRDGVYESILTTARTRLHMKAAALFENTDSVLRAEHLHMAGDPRAARAYLDAARLELAKYRYEQAIALLTKGKPLAIQPADRVDLALALGEAQHDIGALEEARTAFSGALELTEDDAARCRAWLGLAGVKRIIEDLDGALADIDSAEAAARQQGLVAEEARAHYLRGNILFPRGDIEGCMREHGTALALAKQAGSVEVEAAALGGLADAEYLRGRFRSACERFTECVETSRMHGLGRIEVANQPMIAITAIWCGELQHALEVALESIGATQRVGHGRAEMVAHHGAFFCYRMRADFDLARQHIEPAILLARSLGARRFEAEAMLFKAELDYLVGDRKEALETARTAVVITRESGMSYMGPTVLGGLVLITDDKAERRAASAEAEALLAARSISHNHVLFRIYAIEACLRDGIYDEAQRHADVLAAYCQEPGLRLITFFADRGRALAHLGRGESSGELAAEIDRLIAVGEQMLQAHAVADLRNARAVLLE